MAELPWGWVVASLQDVALINPKHPPETKSETMVSFVPMQAVSESGWKFLRTEERRFSDVRKGYTHFAEGDVLLAKITPCFENGKAAIARELRNGLGCGTTELHVLRPLEGLRAEYLYHYLHQESFRHGAVPSMTGTAGQLRVPLSYVEQARLPLPPLPEQRRIVAKLEEVLGKVDACQKRLDRIPLILKRFRQSVLAAACSGRLTEEWRKDRKESLPPHKVVEQLKARRLHAAKTPTETQRLQEVYEYREERDRDELPDSWAHVALRKLCSSLDYGSARKSQPSGSVPVLRMGNIQDGRLDWSDLLYSSDKEEIAKYALKPRTVLFNRTNSPELVGKTAIYNGERPAIFAGYLIRVNVEDILDPDYLNLCLNTPHAKQFCSEVKTDGVSQSNINARSLGKFEVPFCSIQEQREIVRRVDALFKLADRIEFRYQAAKASVDQLTQSILAKAFRGELVPQDPKDESASKLLERIQAKGSRPMEAARA